MAYIVFGKNVQITCFLLGIAHGKTHTPMIKCMSLSNHMPQITPKIRVILRKCQLWFLVKISCTCDLILTLTYAWPPHESDTPYHLGDWFCSILTEWHACSWKPNIGYLTSLWLTLTRPVFSKLKFEAYIRSVSSRYFLCRLARLPKAIGSRDIAIGWGVYPPPLHQQLVGGEIPQQLHC